MDLMQATNPDEMTFCQGADTFYLTATLHNNRLTVTMKDFVDWIIYSK